jgi:hypothetical protein
MKKFIVYNLESPMPSHPAFLKIAACGFPKLQVFKYIYTVTDIGTLKSLLVSNKYKGDILFSQQRYPSPVAVEYNRSMRADLSSNDRVNADIKVETFSLNKIEITVKNPLDSPAVLFYSDAWHENWKAYVNGVQMNVYPANLAFKAVEIPKGVSRVEFHFAPVGVKILNWVLIYFNILMFVCLIGIALHRCFLHKEMDI